MTDFFLRISSSDYTIIKASDKRIQQLFAGVGGSVSLVGLFAFLSFGYGIEELFDDALAGLLIGLFFSGVVFNLYVLLLTTLEKNLVPRTSSFFSRLVSYLVRIGFIVFLAIILSKPVELFFLEGRIAKPLKEFKDSIYLNSERIILEDYIEESDPIIRKIMAYRAAGYIEGNSHYVELTNDFSLLTKERDKRLADLEERINKSKFFIARLELLNKYHPRTWILTFFVIVFFGLPLILKFLVSRITNFYEIKGQLEKEFIEKDYLLFKQKYVETFEEQGIPNVEFQELRYADPPFNTKEKVDERNFEDEKQLIELLNLEV